MASSINSSPADYKAQLKQLTPVGLAWPIDDDSNWIKFLEALAQEPARVDALACYLIDEVLPDTTALLLPNWERVAGLPDECSELGDSLAVRRQNLLAKLASRGGQTKQYFIDVAAALGFVITITEFDQFRVGRNAVGDPLYGQDWEFTWQVNAPETTVTWFRTGQSTAGDPLRSWGNDRLECVLTRLKPAHTIVIFTYG